MNFYQIFMKFTADRVSLNDFSHSDSLSRGGIFFCCKAECHSFQEMYVSACAQTVCRRCSTKKIIFIKTKQKFWCSFINFLIIFLSSLFQLFIYIYSKYNGLFETNLRYQFSYEKIINFIYNVFLKSIFGRDLTHQIFFDIYSKINILLLLLVLLFLFLFLVIAILKNIKKDNILIILGLLFIAESFLAFFGSKMQQVQGRYAVIPAFLFMIVIYRLYQTQIDSIKRLSIILIIFSLLTGVYQFKYKATYPQFLDCFNCPVWKEEISKWRLDNSYKIKIWNYPTRTMLLK